MTSPMIEPTQADRDAAERWGTGPVYNMYHLAKAFARHRLASTPASGEVVAWMYRWKLDGEYVNWRYSDASNYHKSLGGYEEIPLYKHAAPSHPAADLVEALQYAVDMYGKPGGPWNVPSDPGGWLDRARAALSRYAKEGA